MQFLNTHEATNLVDAFVVDIVYAMSANLQYVCVSPCRYNILSK